METIKIESQVQAFFENFKEIPVAEIVQSDEVRGLCERNSCGFYGTNWACPPAVVSLEAFKETFDKFTSMLVVYQVFKVRSSFDVKGMTESSRQFKMTLQRMKEHFDKKFAKGSFLVLGMGSCDLCNSCSYLKNEPCRRPEDMIVSLEACGIDVMRLMNDHGLKYYNGKNTITLVAAVLV